MRKRNYFPLLLITIISIVISGCTKGEQRDAMEEKYVRITQEEAKEMMNKENTIILDVRTKAEYDEGFIENAVLLPVTDIKERAEEVLPDKNTTILVYCRSGNRSKTASKELINLGYTNVYDFGGINSWKYGIVK